MVVSVSNETLPNYNLFGNSNVTFWGGKKSKKRKLKRSRKYNKRKSNKRKSNKRKSRR